MKTCDGMTLLMGSWLALAIPLTFTSCLRRDVDKRLLKNVTLSQDWLEFEADPQLKPSRQVQMIVLVTSQPFEPELTSISLRLSDGTIAKPEVDIVDQYGNSYELKTQTVIGETEVGYWSVELPTDRTYMKVRLRSNHRIDCEEVIWRCHNWK